MTRALQISRIVILTVWACFFGWLVSYGQNHLGRLLHPDLWWLVTSATVILALFLTVNLRRQIVSSQQGNFWLRWPALIILLVPLLYFIPAQKGRFNAATLEKRAIQTESGFIQGNLAPDSSVSNDYPPLLPKKGEATDIPLTRLVMRPDKYQDQEIEVVCKTFVDERLPEDLFMCYRYLMNCCAADAMPVFLFVRHPEAGTITHDAWIQAKGTFSLMEKESQQFPSLQADSILYIKEPPFPYLFL